MITSFPKVFALGTNYIKDIFNEPVSVTCKLDGSQISFANLQGELHMRSKGAILYRDNPTKMFVEGIAQICGRYDRGLLPEGLVFHGEYLRIPRHNCLTYNRVPTNHIALFSVSTASGEFFPYEVIQEWACRLNFDSVPEFFRGLIKSVEEVQEFMDRESYLGGPKIEGIVVKNYERKFLLGGQPMPLMAGKLVSSAFKEVNRSTWKGEKTSGGRWEIFKQGYCTEARFLKAIQHLAERDELTYEPKDIGKFLKEVQRDIVEEEKEIIMQMLWSEFSQDLLRTAVRGGPDYYKEWLLKRSAFLAEDAAIEMGG